MLRALLTPIDVFAEELECARRLEVRDDLVPARPWRPQSPGQSGLPLTDLLAEALVLHDAFGDIHDDLLSPVGFLVPDLLDSHEII